MNPEVELDRITTLLARFQAEISLKNSMSDFYINNLAEQVFAPILGLAFDLPDLKLLELEKSNFPAVDLGDDVAKVAIQITSETTLAKVKDTLKKFKHHKLGLRYSSVIVYMLRPKPVNVEAKDRKAIAEIDCTFDCNRDILDDTDLSLRLKTVTDHNRRTVLDLLESAFGEIKGDSIDQIRTAIENESKRILQPLRLPDSDQLPIIERPEIARIQDQLSNHKIVLLLGDAGTGKTGIAARLYANLSQTADHFPILLSARRMANATTKAGLRDHFGLHNDLASAIKRLSLKYKCLVILDQFEYIADLQSATTLFYDFIGDCLDIKNVRVVVIARKRESYELAHLVRLEKHSPKEVTSEEVPSNQRRQLLTALGFQNINDFVLKASANLLNLRILATIKKSKPDFEIAADASDVELWRNYVEEKKKIENEVDPRRGDRVMHKAVELSRMGLTSLSGEFQLQAPPHPDEQALVSNGMVVKHEPFDLGNMWHEKLQDYLYASFLCKQRMMPQFVASVLPRFRRDAVILYMNAIYESADAPTHTQFLYELLLGHDVTDSAI